MDAPLRLEEVWKIALGDKSWSWRCAWLIACFIQDLQEYIHPKRLELLAVIEQKAPGHQRELLRIIARIDLARDELGMLYDCCLDRCAYVLWNAVFGDGSNDARGLGAP